MTTAKTLKPHVNVFADNTFIIDNYSLFIKLLASETLPESVIVTAAVQLLFLDPTYSLRSFLEHRFDVIRTIEPIMYFIYLIWT